MVRDFRDVTTNNLRKAIDQIQDKVDPLTWDAIEAVRTVGNIAAHMEKDINLIVDIDQDEATRLIRLIELLINDWYIAREERKLKLEEMKQLGQQKKNEQQGSTDPATEA